MSNKKTAVKSAVNSAPQAGEVSLTKTSDIVGFNAENREFAGYLIGARVIESSKKKNRDGSPRLMEVLIFQNDDGTLTERWSNAVLNKALLDGDKVKESVRNKWVRIAWLGREKSQSGDVFNNCAAFANPEKICKNPNPLV